jgi:hypothetical protein
LSRRARWIRNGPMWPSGWPTWPGGNTPPAPRRPSRPEGNRVEERLRPYGWLGWGVAGLGGFSMGWLVGWGGGAATANHRPRADPRSPACAQQSALIPCVTAPGPSGRLTEHGPGFREVSICVHLSRLDSNHDAASFDRWTPACSTAPWGLTAGSGIDWRHWRERP